jgi:uncharacterized protein DUF6644
MNFDAVLHWLQDLSLPTAIRENDNLFPWFESVHVLAIVVVVGSISIVDLRLLGIASRDRPVGRLLHDVLRVTWGAFAVALIAGSLLFSARAVDYAHNFYFQGKMVLMALAGINMAAFHVFIGRDVEQWGAAARPPLAARTAGALSLTFWIGVVAFGRWIGFSLH